MPIYPYQDKWPLLGERVFLAPSADVAGDVTLGDDVSFWFQTAARGDVNRIQVGHRSNVQDGTVLHVTYKDFPLEIGEDVVIGHSAMVHGCVLENGCLIGIGARILDGCVVEEGAQVGAGAVVTPGTRVPAGHLALGVPAKVVRELDRSAKQTIRDIADRYRRLKDEYREAIGDGCRRVTASSAASRPESPLPEVDQTPEMEHLTLRRALAPEGQKR